MIRLLKANGFEELRTGKGSHRQFWHPGRRTAVTVAVHAKKEIGTGLLNRILRDAGLKNKS